MVKLFDKENGNFICTITTEQFDFLADRLEEESLEDRDYAITPMTLALFEGEGADPILVSFLRAALGTRDEMSINWEKEE